MADHSFWSDADKQLSVIEMAGGLNKPLIVKGSGNGRVIEYTPAFTPLGATTTLSVEQLLSGIIEVTGAGPFIITLPEAADLAAYLNGTAASRNGTKLQVGSSIWFSINSIGAVLTVNAGTDGTIGSHQTIAANDSAHYLLRFDDVTVGAESYDVRALAGATA